MYKEEEMSLEYFDILDEEGNKTGKTSQKLVSK